MKVAFLQDFRNKVQREKSKERLSTLIRQYGKNHYTPLLKDEKKSTPIYFFSEHAARAGIKSGTALLLQCGISAVLGALLGFFVHIGAVLPLSLLGFFIPVYFAHTAARERSLKFSEEYPVVLMATASNMKAGLTVYNALERAILLLPEESDVKKEVKIFLERISGGMPKDEAVRQFARYISLPELDLFRRAFILVLGHGGKFSRTLERLAQVCRDRENLIKSARVSTASMRMTAHILLGVAPVLVAVMSLRTPDYWNILFSNSVAFTLGCIGSFIILGSFFVLRYMSDFKA